MTRSTQQSTNQRTLTGETATESKIPLRKAEPKVWDDGSKTTLWNCPDCGTALLAESECIECGWWSRQRWDVTLRRERLDGGADV
ncbi:MULTISPECIES: hypothetical protein [unclassified Haloferax]|uniref:hypothetical protein n=1 Tax=unclassified Haloferax TaxID=2625095 RepID=UPI0011C027DF|nr:MULTISPECIES: hypothetical protein [unclassified Haloferax]